MQMIERPMLDGNYDNQAERQHETLRANGYVVIRSFITLDVARLAYRYALMKVANGEGHNDFTDTQVPDTPSFYGDTLADSLLENAVPTVESIVGEALWPTYSYMRVYKRGDQLAPHVDRPSCEVSMTLTLGYDVTGAGDPNFRWPIFMDNSADFAAERTRACQPAELGDGTCVLLGPGDGVVYYGTEVRHWRDPFPGEHHAQVFLHFVRQDGPYASNRFDFRPRLGAPYVKHQPME